MARSQLDILRDMRLVNGLENHPDLVGYWKFNEPGVCVCVRARARACGVPHSSFDCSWLQAMTMASLGCAFKLTLWFTLGRWYLAAENDEGQPWLHACIHTSVLTVVLTSVHTVTCVCGGGGVEIDRFTATCTCIHAHNHPGFPCDAWPHSDNDEGQPWLHIRFNVSCTCIHNHYHTGLLCDAWPQIMTRGSSARTLRRTTPAGTATTCR